MSKNNCKTIMSVLLVVTLVLSTPLSFGVFAMSFDDSLNRDLMCFSGEILPGKVIVCLNEPFFDDLSEILPEVNIASYEDIYLSVVNVAKKLKNDIKKPISDMIGTTFVIELDECTVDAVFSAINSLEYNSYVKYAEPDRYAYEDQTIPNDPLYAYPTAIPQWGLPKVNAPEAWDYVTGSDATESMGDDGVVKIAVLDSGVDDEQEDLADNLDMSLAYNSYEQVLGNTIDNRGHGTHVTGIIGAVGNNEIGVAGVCWNVDIVPVKITPWSSSQTPMDAVSRAIIYIDTMDIPIANLSYSLQYDTTLFTAIENYSNSGGLLFKSAGNGGDNDDINSVFQRLDQISGVIIVGALAYDMDSDVAYDGSNYGANTVDLFAPGEQIRSTVFEDQYHYMTGTSMATPFVTGAAALLKFANTSLTSSDIKSALLNGVTASSNLINSCSTGGRLNIYNSLRLLGKQVSVSNSMSHGSVRSTAIFADSNTMVNLIAYPNAGYMLKPGTMMFNSTPATMLYRDHYCFLMPNVDVCVTAQFYMVGDVDMDGSVTVTDALIALRHSSGLSVLVGDAFLAGDVDGDNDVDTDDAQLILSYAGGAINIFPIEEG